MYRQFLIFPQLNLFSGLLLGLVLLGYGYAALLLRRYLGTRKPPDLFLALLLVAHGFTTTSYIIGFLGWYDTYPTTKVNYLLFNVSFLFGPLLYFYIKSLTTPRFKFGRIDVLHFLPFALNLLYEVFLLVYDASQPGFAEVQNGVLLSRVDLPYVYPFIEGFAELSQVIYLTFSVYLYVRYRNRLVHFFSNTYRVELNWIRNFLIAYVSLFAVHFVFGIVNTQVVQLHWIQNWWSRVATAAMMLYVGFYGFRTDVRALYDLAPSEAPAPPSAPDETPFAPLLSQLRAHMVEAQPYLNPELTLADLARQLGIGSNLLSQVINAGLGVNFNDYVNRYRVDAVKGRLAEGDARHLSLLGIALECGFNSKATFNRTFKKLTQQTPSQYQAALEKEDVVL